MKYSRETELKILEQKIKIYKLKISKIEKIIIALDNKIYNYQDKIMNIKKILEAEKIRVEKRTKKIKK